MSSLPTGCTDADCFMPLRLLRSSFIKCTALHRITCSCLLPAGKGAEMLIDKAVVDLEVDPADGQLRWVKLLQVSCWVPCWWSQGVHVSTQCML